MNKKKQRSTAHAYKKLRTLTTGMRVMTWESWVAEYDAENNNQTYHCICKDRFGHPINRAVFQVAASINRTWLVKIRVKCVAEDGRVYVEETELEAPNVKLDDFTALYKAEREATINACNPKHIRDVGWLAITKD